jgi:hypothetical protein
VLWSLGSLVLAVVALAVSLPLWLVPPLILVLPPLIWGWLTYRVMTFDALAEYASADERARGVSPAPGWPLLVMGIISGFHGGGAEPVVWASGALFAAALFLVLVPLVAIWIYTLVFAFSSLWFAHFGSGGIVPACVPQAAPVAARCPCDTGVGRRPTTIAG